MKKSALLVVALAIVVHAPSLRYPFLLDDGVQIFKNPAVTAGAPLGAYFFDRETTSSKPDYNRVSWRPLRTLAFRALVLAGGVRRLPIALANLALYAMAALLVLALLRRIVPDEAAAAWATALWVVLPVHVEPVAYASALGDQLSLVLELGAIVVAFGARWPRAVASTLLAAAAMLAKESAVTEPVLLALVALACDAATARRLGRRAAVHALVAVGYVALRTHVVGSLGGQEAATLASGLREAPWLLVHYLWISVAPLGHAAVYRVSRPGVVELLLAIIGYAGALALAWRWRRAVAVGLAWFAVALAPVLHLVAWRPDPSDRFALVSTVGLAIAVAAAAAPLSRRRALVFAALVVVYAAASVIEARPWQSDALLWRYAVDRQPNAPLARANLAAVFLDEGRVDEAAAQLEALHALGYTRSDLELKRAYVLARLGRGDEAARAVALALRLDADNGAAHALAGQLALAAGDAATAAREHAAARRLAPAHASTGLLGYELLRADDERVDYLRALQALSFDDSDGAIRAARACLQRAPARVQCQAVLGRALTLQGAPEGRALLERCVAALPEGPDRQQCREAKWSTRR